MTKVEPKTDSEEGTNQPNEDLLASNKKTRTGLLRLAAWKLALIGTAAAVVIIGGGVGAGVGLSGGGDGGSSSQGVQNTLPVYNETDGGGNITAINSSTTLSPNVDNSTSGMSGSVNSTADSPNNVTEISTSAAVQSNSSSNNITIKVTKMNNSSLDVTSTLAPMEPNTTTMAPVMSTTTVRTTTVITAPVTGGSRLERTTIFLRYESSPGENLFLRGGLSNSARRTCGGELFRDPCVIPIQYYSIPSADHFSDYRDWSSGDNYIDWTGSEATQGTRSRDSKAAAGTPTVWTTNTGTADSHVALNTYGQHYWMVDLLMDCSKTDGGWFDLKGYVARDSGDGTWEGSISQATNCGGSAGGTTPRNEGNHVVFCGKINVFKFGEGSCRNDNYPAMF